MWKTEGVRPSLSLFRYGEPHIRYFFSTDESLPERCFECVEYLALEGEEEVREELARRKYLLKINTTGYREHYGEFEWTGDPRMIYDYDYLFALVALDPSPRVRLTLLQRDRRDLMMRGFLRVPHLIPIYALDRDRRVRKLFWELWYGFMLNLRGMYSSFPYPDTALALFFPDEEDSQRWERWLYFYEEDKERYEELLHGGNDVEIVHLLLRPDVGLFDVRGVMSRLSDEALEELYNLGLVPSYLKILHRNDPKLRREEELGEIVDVMWMEKLERNPELENAFLSDLGGVPVHLRHLNVLRAGDIVKKAFSKRVRQLPDDWRGHLKGLMQKLFY